MPNIYGSKVSLVGYDDNVEARSVSNVASKYHAGASPFGLLCLVHLYSLLV